MVEDEISEPGEQTPSWAQLAEKFGGIPPQRVGQALRIYCYAMLELGGLVVDEELIDLAITRSRADNPVDETHEAKLRDYMLNLLSDEYWRLLIFEAVTAGDEDLGFEE